jgi:MFS family permease
MPEAFRQDTRQMLKGAIVRPLKMLVFSPIVLLISLYGGILFGLIFLLFTTFPSVFGGTYGFDAGMAGLTYIGLGLGMVLGLVLFGILSDKLLGQKKGETTTKPEDRLILMKWIGPITPLGLFMYGWSAHYQTHWMVPILGTFIVGLGSLFIVIPGQIYLVDSFGTEAAASATAANLLVRSPFGAFLVLAAAPLYERLGLGWGNSVLGFICLAFTPVPWLFHRYGEGLRLRFPVKL